MNPDRTITIDAEFQALCPPLLPEEREQLEASLLAEGCREPLCVWLEQWETLYCKYCGTDRPVHFEQGRWECDECAYGLEPEVYLLLDGHNRYTLCEQHTLAFHTETIFLRTREEAINWIIANQLGRRNLTPEQKSYLRGKRYNLEKTSGHGKSAHNFQEQNTSKRLATEYKVAPATIQADGQFTAAVDTLEAQVRQDIRDTVLRRQEREQGKITKKHVTKTGKLVQDKTVAPQPFMRREGWKPYQVLEAIDVLGELPQDEHPALNRLLDQPFIPGDDGLEILRNLQHVPRDGRQQIYALHASQDPRDRSDAMTLAARKRPEPDPQIGLAKHLMRALEGIREQQRRNWRNKPEYADEPWISELDAIDALLSDVQKRWGHIASQAEISWQKRIANYATPLPTR